MELEVVKPKPGDITKSFDHYFKAFENQANEWMEKAKEIQVTDASQTDVIAKAEEGLKVIKSIEKGIDAKHKELKENALREGQILDSIKRRLKAIVEPIKDHLQANVNFVELQEEKRKNALRDERIALLEPYIGEQAKLMQLGDMDQAVFDAVLLGQKTAKEQKEAADKEAARIKAENEEKARRDQAERNLWLARVNLITPFGLVWNQELQSYVKDDFNISLVEIKTDTDDQFSEKCLKISNEISKRREKELRDKKKQDEKLANEKALRKEAEDKLKAQQEEADRKAAEERKLKRAPDKQKLQAYAEQIKALTQPEVKEREAKEILLSASGLLEKVVKYINTKAAEL